MTRFVLGTLVLLFALPSAAQTRSLADVIDAIETEHLRLDAADVPIGQAEALRAQAIARTRPQVSLRGTYTFRDEGIEFAGGNPFSALAPYLETVAAEHPDADLPDPSLFAAEGDPQIIQYRHDIGGSLIVQQTLFNMRSRPYLRQTEVMIAEAENGRDWTEFELRAAVLGAYFRAVLQHRLIEVAERNEELARLSFEAAAGLNEEGAGNRFEVNRAEVELSRASRETENARTAHAVALRNLRAIAGIDEPFDVEEPPLLDVPERTAVPMDRPDLVAHDLVAERADWTVREARARWYPSLVAIAQANVQRESAFGGDRFAGAIQVIASWDVFDGGQRSALCRQLEGDVVAAELNHQLVVDELEAAIDSVLLSIEQLQRDIESAQAESELAEENLALTQEAERIGVATALDTQLAREQLFLTELALVSATVSLQASVYELHRLVGSEPWR